MASRNTSSSRGRNAVTLLPAYRPDLLVVNVELSDHVYPRHTHDEFGFGVMCSGAQHSVYGSKYRTTCAGQLMLTNPGEVHDGEPVDTATRHFRMFYIAPQLVWETAAEIDDRFGQDLEIAPSAAGDQDLATQLLHLHARVPDGPADALALDGMLFEILGGLIRRHGSTDINRPVRRADVQRAVDFIQDCPTKSHDLGDLARLAGLSRYHFVRAFKAETGLTPHAFVIQRRLREAVGLLRKGWPIAAAAVESGFYDQAHLTRHFKKVFGAPPGRLFPLAHRQQ